MDLGYNVIFIAVLYAIVELAKTTVATTDKRRALLPYVAALVGGVAAYIVFIINPDVLNTHDALSSILVGVGSGLLATGANQLYKQGKKILNGDFKGISEELDEILESAEEIDKETSTDVEEKVETKVSDYDPSVKG